MVRKREGTSLGLRQGEQRCLKKRAGCQVEGCSTDRELEKREVPENDDHPWGTGPLACVWLLRRKVGKETVSLQTRRISNTEAVLGMLYMLSFLALEINTKRLLHPTKNS